MRPGHPHRTRLDRLLVDRGLVESRERAQGLILAGQILVDEQKVEKCGALVRCNAALRMVGEPAKYREPRWTEAGRRARALSRQSGWQSMPRHWLFHGRFYRLPSAAWRGQSVCRRWQALINSTGNCGAIPGGCSGKDQRALPDFRSHRHAGGTRRPLTSHSFPSL